MRATSSADDLPGASGAPPGAPDPEALRRYYADRGRLLRNMLFIQFGWWGHSVCVLLTTALTLLHMRQCGVEDKTLALLASINGWAVSFLVMYFSWRSDHTVSRWGRRVPYLLLSMPFIVTCVALVPFFTNTWSLIILYLVGALFMDMKLSTYPLLSIDCVPRHLLGRMWSIQAMVTGVTGFVVLRWGMRLAEVESHAPFLICAAVLAIATVVAALGIREPPIRNPATGPFRPWSTFAIGFRDRRIIWLMLGVAGIHGLWVLWQQWHVLWASHPASGLGLAKSDMGDALSWGSFVPLLVALPTGWLIDRVSGLKLVVLLWALQLAAYIYLATQAQGVVGLAVLAMLMAVIGPLYTAADIMVYKDCPPEDIGSLTSTNSFIRNLLNACVGLFAGQLIAAGGTDRPDYRAAFTVGMVFATVSLCCFAFWRRAMRRGPAPALSPTAAAAALAVPVAAVAATVAAAPLAAAPVVGDGQRA